jgi:diguanylate cyclase (GGDEF)-like protein
MTFAKLLRLPFAGGDQAQRPENVSGTPAWPYDNPMLLGIPQSEFTASVRRAIWVLLGEARNLRNDLERTRGLLRDAEEAVDRDHLLPLLNRRAFGRELARQIAFASRYATPASLIYIDLDGLKLANDTYGHAGGDAVLAHFSAILLATLRSSDLVGRLGGDEFGIILLHADERQAQSTCMRIAELAADKPLEWQGTNIPIPFTFGVIQLAAGMNAETALAAADLAMYRNKSLRR